MRRVIGLWAGMAIIIESAVAQLLVPTGIDRAGKEGTNAVTLSWPTIPGRTYDIWTRDGVEELWVATNSAPIKARSTRGALDFLAGEDEVPVRFFQVREQAVPAGNTAPITSTTVAELEKVLGLTFTSSQRSQISATLSSSRASFEAMRKIRLLNGDSLPLIFDPTPDGFAIDGRQEPIVWSEPVHTTVPTNRADLAFYSARDLGELIRTRQITSTELTQLYLERLKRYDSALHCVITVTEELALKQAARADAELAAGEYRGPLHGLPYGIKDLFSTRGYRTTWGAAPFRDQIIEEDATVVKKLEAAGAVLVAKLSTGELAMDDRWFGGQTRNPWNVSEGSGGSSAGPASATAAGLVAFAIGTETWGSIVFPSTRCRVTGLRTTLGRVSRAGAMTLCWSMDKVGPICRTVEDCAMVMEAIRGADGLDHAVVNAPFNYSSKADLKKVRVGYRGGQLSSTILNRLRSLVGAEQVVPVQLPAKMLEAILIIRAEGAAAFDELTRFGGDAYLASSWPATFREGRAVPAVEYLQANRLRKKMIASMAELMTKIDVYVGTEQEMVVGDADEITNLTGNPCVVIPHGGGTSLGIVGRPFEEATILALARAYQDSTPYHTNRPPAFVR